MHEEVETKIISPTFSVRIVITDAERKITFIGNGDKNTSGLFFTVLKRLEERIKKSELSTEPFCEVEEKKDKELVLSMSKENIEELLQAVLFL